MEARKRGSGNAEKLMRLQAQSPAWMIETIAERGPRVRLTMRPVHRLEEEVVEIEALEALGLSPLLGVHELELVAGTSHEVGFRLGAHT
jgi:hypothetical protein